ncbi:hypothetical protein CYMTET_41575 [Cymbomonas tetramitiformis]|uniref:Uncharacterized protein n=1 Tax=Cymbomonas tetramitiformis TaxID=36881 RepID=A0AAE0C7J0_9CHLO|nr:hypothetical protein CYMTET_41575 [Cymbomonas tetramitiformis]
MAGDGEAGEEGTSAGGTMPVRVPDTSELTLEQTEVKLLNLEFENQQQQHAAAMQQYALSFAVLTEQVKSLQEGASSSKGEKAVATTMGDAELEIKKKLPYVPKKSAVSGLLVSALAYFHDAVVYEEDMMDWLQTLPPGQPLDDTDELYDRLVKAHNTKKGVYSLLCNRYTMLTLRASLDAEGGGTDAVRAKLAFMEEKVNAGTEGVVGDSVMKKWLDEFDATKSRAMMTATAKQATQTARATIGGWSDSRIGHPGVGRGAQAPSTPNTPTGQEAYYPGGSTLSQGSMARRGREQRDAAMDCSRGEDAVGVRPTTHVRSRYVAEGSDCGAAAMAFHREGASVAVRRVGTGTPTKPRISGLLGEEARHEQVASGDGSAVAELLLREVAVQDGDPEEAAAAGERGRLQREGRLCRGADQTGARVLPYMDDFLVIVKTQDEAYVQRDRVSRQLVRLGLFWNEKQGHWEPTQVAEHLGLEVDLKDGLFRLLVSCKLRERGVETVVENIEEYDEVRIGRKIEIFWPVDQVWCPGTVGETGADGKRKIEYDNGDVEYLELEKEKYRLLPAEDPVLATTWRMAMVKHWAGKVRDSSLAEEAAEMQAAALQPSTAGNYEGHWRMFVDFCANERRDWLPATEETVLLYIAYKLRRRTVRGSSLQPYLSAINNFHEDFGHTGPAKGRAVTRAVKGMTAMQTEAAEEQGCTVTMGTWLPAVAVRRVHKAAGTAMLWERLLCDSSGLSVVLQKEKGGNHTQMKRRLFVPLDGVEVLHDLLELWEQTREDAWLHSAPTRTSGTADTASPQH